MIINKAPQKHQHPNKKVNHYQIKRRLREIPEFILNKKIDYNQVQF